MENPDSISNYQIKQANSEGKASNERKGFTVLLSEERYSKVLIIAKKRRVPVEEVVDKILEVYQTSVEDAKLASEVRALRVSEEVADMADRESADQWAPVSVILRGYLDDHLYYRENGRLVVRQGAFCLTSAVPYIETKTLLRELSSDLRKSVSKLVKALPDELQLKEAAFDEIRSMQKNLARLISRLGLFGRMPCLYLTPETEGWLRDFAQSKSVSRVLVQLIAQALGDKNLWR